MRAALLACINGVGRAFSALGHAGPWLLVLSLLSGLAIPELAALAHVLLPVSAFLLTLGSFLVAGLSPRETGVSLTLAALAVAWAGVAVPAVAALSLAAADPSPAMHAGILLSVLAPPIGSAAAIAAMLNLRPRLALTSSICLTVIAPLTMPVLASVLDSGLSLNASIIAQRLIVIVGSASIIATILIRYRRGFIWLVPDVRAASGISVVGLVIVGLATTDGIRTAWFADAGLFLAFLAIAVAVNLLTSAVSACAFLFAGVRNACTVGLVSGNRNITLAWAAAGGTLSSFTESYVAACVIPILSLPLVIRLIVSARMNPGRRVKTASQA